MCVLRLASFALAGFLFAAMANANHHSDQVAGDLPLNECFESGGQQKPNLLFIAVDDLRPELHCYGAEHIHSPSIDRLAASGLLFERAYCQQAVCNPSRTSLMTGLRPDTIGVTHNHIHFRTNRPGVVTLPQHFRNNGYHAQAIGKIYHGVFPEGASITKWDTMGDPQSWSVPAIRFGPRYYYTEEGIAAAKETFQRVYKPKNPAPDDWTRKLVFGLATESPDVPDDTLFDGKVAASAVKTLRKLSQNRERPFFLAVGFIKPHSPYIAPKKYFDLYPQVDLFSQCDFPAHAPNYAGHNSGELRRYTDQPGQGEIPEANRRRVRQAYFACISYIDAQIGRVLEELESSGLADNTIVCLYGDHGYHLGEHGLWGKTTNFELDTRVPLIIRSPGMEAAGKKTSSLVELLDLYPTLANLAGLPVGNQLEGRSFKSILDDPTYQTKPFALSQYPRRGGMMGYSIRTSNQRLTQWVHQETGEVRDIELYEYSNGLIETENLANQNPGLVANLSQQLSNAFGKNFSDAAPMRQEHNNGTSFENESAGPFDQLNTSVGTWKTVEGKALVDDKHAATGNQCLQLAGGKQTLVELRISDGLDTTGQLRFAAERWTKRAPFKFRIEKLSGGKWTEIYDGDQSIRVGRPFLSDVRVPLNDPAIKELRFSVSSPPNTGILIDDLHFTPEVEQTIVEAKVEPLTVPALVGVAAAPILKFNIRTAGSKSPKTFQEVRASLTKQTDAADIESFRLYFTGSQGEQFSTATPVSDSVAVTGNLRLRGAQTLQEGDNYFWVTGKLKSTANIDHQIGVSLEEVYVDSTPVSVSGAPSLQRLGVAVRKSGDDGVHTYRIPGLVRTNKNTLIAVYDIRHDSSGDLPGNIDVGMSRSTDGGRTWASMKTIIDMGDDPKWKFDGVGDPSVLVDRATGTIWVSATWSHGNRSWRGSGPGLKPEETGQWIMVRSDDDGVTWSDPINITTQVKKPEWCFLLQGPGKGITMSDGTLVFPAQYQDPPNEADKTAHRLPHSTFIFSRDHGKSWQIASGAFDDTTESQIVELGDGKLMLNCRYNRGDHRIVTITEDMGRTWIEHSPGRKSLIEPRGCMASLIHVGRDLGQPANGLMLFSNPNNKERRSHLTIKATSDSGESWPRQHQLLLDEQSGRGYSCMAMIDDETIGILYESSQADLAFQRIPLMDVMNGNRHEHEWQSLYFDRVFTDHMVLQAGQPIRVRGQAKPGNLVSVSFMNQTTQTQADANGKWSALLAPQQRNSKPQPVIAKSGEETAILRDVLVGEVWLCAGQSNMEWWLAKSTNGRKTLDHCEDNQLRLMDFVGAARGDGRMYDEATAGNLRPDLFCQGHWRRSNRGSAQKFSAIGFYFGQQLRKELDCPVGIIDVAVGGTPIEAWISDHFLETMPDLAPLRDGNWLENRTLSVWCRDRARHNLQRGLDGQQMFELPGDEFGPNHSFKPGFMFASAIEPFAPMAVAGILWYQGESNAQSRGEVEQYNRVFPHLVTDWTLAFQSGDFPFLFVQLPGMNRPDWPAFREYQRRSLSKIENASMAITIDLGDRNDVHPRQKKPVAERLARLALAQTYGRNIVTSGPRFRDYSIARNHVTLTFEHCGDGLKTSDGEPPRHFEIAAADGKFVAANARIKGEQIIVSSEQVTEPKHVRYAWKPFPEPPVNLVNSTNLPASPFTTQENF